VEHREGAGGEVRHRLAALHAHAYARDVLSTARYRAR
jgi:hypothetical protein